MIRVDGSLSAGAEGSCPRHGLAGREERSARDALDSLLGEPVVSAHVTAKAPIMSCFGGSAGGSRTAAWCVSPRGRDVNCAMVKGGLGGTVGRLLEEAHCL